jgi:hypothetical protein
MPVHGIVCRFAENDQLGCVIRNVGDKGAGGLFVAASSMRYTSSFSTRSFRILGVTARM